VIFSRVMLSPVDERKLRDQPDRLRDLRRTGIGASRPFPCVRARSPNWTDSGRSAWGAQELVFMPLSGRCLVPRCINRQIREEALTDRSLYGTTVCGPIQARAARPIYRASLAGEVGSPRAAPLSGEGNTPRHLWMLAGRKVPVTPTLSGKRNEEYICADFRREVLASARP